MARRDFELSKIYRDERNDLGIFLALLSSDLVLRPIQRGDRPRPPGRTKEKKIDSMYYFVVTLRPKQKV